jgi:trehalose synthase
MPAHLHEVHVAPLPPERFRSILDEQAWTAMEETLRRAAELLQGRVIWNVNSTRAGGGVAEMLQSFVAYARGAGIDMRWSVINGTPEFFRITKRLHNFLHGHAGDGGELGAQEAAVYDEVSRANADELAAMVRPQDAVLLHDPQTAGLAAPLKQVSSALVWRCHVGAEQPNEYVHTAWDFLAPRIEHADASVFTRHAYVPSWIKSLRTGVIQPSIDAFSPKNEDLDPDTIRAILTHVGLLGGKQPAGVVPTFTRMDGSPGRVDHVCDVISAGPPPSPDTPLVAQVSRWDRLKDPLGVMEGFAAHDVDGGRAHLVLAGPSVTGVADDPEGAEVFDEVLGRWRELPQFQRSRVHLASIPMISINENAVIVNALQRHATIVVQKSLQEGFGLTVAEAMWKSRAVVASAVGGIKDQIEDGSNGLLLDDPEDLDRFAELLTQLLQDAELRDTIGRSAHERVRSKFLLDRHARQYVDLLAELMA